MMIKGSQQIFSVFKNWLLMLLIIMIVMMNMIKLEEVMMMTIAKMMIIR